MMAELEAISGRPRARGARKAPDGLAWGTRAEWQRQIGQRLTIRNTFTQRRVLVEPCRTFRLSQMEARVGHTEPYMAWLEDGEPERASKRFRAVPTEVAAGQSPGSLRGGRKKAVRPSAIITRLGDLAVKGGQHRSRKANEALAIRGGSLSG